MIIPDWHEEPIAKHHDRNTFDCTDHVLNDYLRKFARQNHSSGGAKTFLAIDSRDRRILGYCSLAPTSANYEQTPNAARQGLPRHPVPGFRLGRLATDKTVHGSGLGTQLLLAAARRCIRVAGEVGGAALFIDAKTERAARWYEARGALKLIGVPGEYPLPMVMSLRTLQAALVAADRI